MKRAECPSRSSATGATMRLVPPSGRSYGEPVAGPFGVTNSATAITSAASIVWNFRKRRTVSRDPSISR